MHFDFHAASFNPINLLYLVLGSLKTLAVVIASLYLVFYSTNISGRGSATLSNSFDLDLLNTSLSIDNNMI